MEHKGQLAMIGDLRDGLVRTARIATPQHETQSKWYSAADINTLGLLRAQVLKVQHHMTGIATVSAFTNR